MADDGGGFLPSAVLSLEEPRTLKDGSCVVDMAGLVDDCWKIELIEPGSKCGIIYREFARLTS